MPATNVTLKIVMRTMFVKVHMSISDTTHVESAKVRTRFVPNRPLKRPTNNDKNIPITPNNFTTDATDISPPESGKSPAQATLDTKI